MIGITNLSRAHEVSLAGHVVLGRPSGHFEITTNCDVARLRKAWLHVNSLLHYLQTHLISDPSPLARNKAVKNAVEIEGMKQAHVSKDLVCL